MTIPLDVALQSLDAMQSALVVSAYERKTEMLKKNAAWSDGKAVVGDDGFLTYRDLYSHVHHAASALTRLEIKRGTIVGLRFRDPIKHLICSLALLENGITQVAVNPKDIPPLQNKLVSVCGVNLLLEDAADYPCLALPSVLVTQTYAMSLNTSTPTRQTSPVIDDESSPCPAMIFLGSGTTGTPKVIAIDFPLLSHLIERDLAVRSLEHKDRHYCVSSLDYYTAKRRTLGCLARGATVMLPTAPATDLVRYCKDHDIHHLSLTTTQALRLLAQSGHTQHLAQPSLPRLKSLFVGSSPVSQTLRQRIRHEISDQLFVVYGSNEFGEATVASPQDQDAHPGTVGRACPGVRVEIVDAFGNFCTLGNKGHIRLNSARMMHAYPNNPEASTRSFTAQGYYPGDMGSLAPDGNLLFAGRQDDMMIFQGVNIYPREIEQVLEAHPRVTEAAAFPLIVNASETAPFAAVCAKGLSENDLLLHCAGQLGWRKPQRILFMEDFPRNAAGKVLKRVLAEKMAGFLASENKSPTQG